MNGLPSVGSRAGLAGLSSGCGQQAFENGNVRKKDPPNNRQTRSDSVPYADETALLALKEPSASSQESSIR